MIRIFPIVALVGALACANLTLSAHAGEVAPVLVIHGGAGTLTRDRLTPELEADYRAALAASLEVGYERLLAGEPSEVAVIAAIEVLETSPLFNAGIGAVFTHSQTVEHDASIMRGVDQQAGAVAGVSRIRSPINAAFAVLGQSEHVMLSGTGAEAFADQVGLELVDNSVFHTERRLRQLRARQGKSAALSLDENSHKFGTVGAVALDQAGHLSAGTSTGGMTNKRFGRIGDSPIIGAGTWADTDCAVSATGHGEYFIRYAVAHEICARVRLAGASITDAGNAVIFDVLKPIEAEGGVIILSASGEVAMPFNSAGMYRGVMRAKDDIAIEIFASDGAL
ncbi:MAG: isoaspartyl peptidase/L-asparaginase [Pseudomonadaceae bacterium]|nr:isoaspartyl peptidase/L-asparaginase [Pseudomonadaceae bacterium]